MDPGMALDVGLDLVNAPSLKRSPPLLTNEMDRTQDNLFIQGTWDHVLPHLKFVLGFKVNCNPNFRFRFVTDERLLTVYLGKDAYLTKLRDSRDSVVSFNTLSDLVNADFDLIIIRLGFRAYKNRALPDVLREALMHREIKEKPTWIVEFGSYGNPQHFDPDHRAFSSEVWDYIQHQFDFVDLTDKEAPPLKNVPQAEVTTSTVVEDDSEYGGSTVSMGCEAVPEPFEEGPGFEEKPRYERTVAAVHAALGGSTDRSSKKPPRWRRKSGGGDPIG
jgi:hypothetical protein